jgi:hypothetical protein
MIKYFAICLTLLSFLFIGCKKTESSNPPSPDNKIKIEIISGNNQSDTIGHFVRDSVVLKVTKNKQGLGGMLIISKQANCIDFRYSHIFTDSNGIARYKWELNGKTGDQTVLFTVYDSLQIAQNSVTAHAEGKYYNNAWQIADCLPYIAINDVCQSSSGRLFCAMRSLDLPYYSDNGGISFQRLTSFPLAKKEIRQVVAQGKEIFVATRYDGIYYSPDNGTNWQNRSSGIDDAREVVKLTITSSGKLFLSTTYKPVFMSTDKGLHWTPLTTGVDRDDYMTSFCETSTGILYMTSDDNELYKSTTGGTSWVKIHPSVSWNVQAIFVDDNDDLYFGDYHSTAVIYKSTDGGSTWSLKYKSPAVRGIFLQFKDFYKVNGVYYFMITGYGIIKTRDFSVFQFLTYDNSSFEYLVGNDNAVYVPGIWGDLWYNMNP